MRRRPGTRGVPGSCGVRLCAVAAALVALALGGCAGPARLAELAAPATLPPHVELGSTPFYPQADQQCGPAALAAVLGAAGHAVQPEQLAREIFLPGRQGSLQPEIVGAMRARGLLPYEVGRGLGDLMVELAAGRPVLVLQKQGLGPWPAWHYAVAIGYDAGRDRLLLRSGTTERLAVRATVFEATWSRADHWALVALEPGQLPARPDLARYMKGAAGLEAVGQVDAAGAAYSAAIGHWPDEPLPRLGRANVDAARGHWTKAERGYAEVLRLDPGSAAALNNRAEALGRLGCWTAARARSGRGSAPRPGGSTPAHAGAYAGGDRSARARAGRTGPRALSASRPRAETVTPAGARGKLRP